MMRKTLLVAAALLLLPASGQTQEVYSSESRTHYIAQAIAALSDSPDEALRNLYRYIYVVERNGCRAPTESLRLDCMLEAARRNCKQPDASAHERCDRISDVMVINRLSESDFIPKRVAYQIMERQSDYRGALLDELRGQYAELVTELRTVSGEDQQLADAAKLSKAIDAYCVNHAPARNLTWQQCIGAIVWFIGTSGRAIEVSK